MKLYTYDHCPFCVRARMIFGLKQVPLDNTVLLNDDEDTPIRLVGKKLVPIVIKPDGTAMGESLDIVHYIDAYAGGQQLDAHIRPEIEQWLHTVGEYSNRLTMPRCTQIGLPEFATQAAIDYFTRKKTEYIGDFSENLANTPALLKRLNVDLLQLVSWVQSHQALNGQLGLEDIITFPILRGLTMVKGIEWPPAVRAYVESMSQQSRVPLFDSKAI
ncbi:glutaredoxin 2 [Snodgrassella sp. CFCC 13594]|uniref:glutaredoxin 2 n=1 Tax=Snodgrassella sp. CFCC 13594 TaxID=1775559 RepID=UPI00082B82B0|nr:glutaredoxin 2 [Snodgrassella sp. CFCC 13594]